VNVRKLFPSRKILPKVNCARAAISWLFAQQKAIEDAGYARRLFGGFFEAETIFSGEGVCRYPEPEKIVYDQKRPEKHLPSSSRITRY